MRGLPLLATALIACSQAVQAPDVATFDQSTQALQSAVQQHCATAAPTTRTDCNTEMATYMGKANPLVQQMQSGSANIDACMQNMNHASDADMVTTCNGIAAEFTRHQQQACSDDASVMAGEQNRHCSAMNEQLTHVTNRMQEMSGMMTDAGMMSSGGMMSTRMCEP